MTLLETERLIRKMSDLLQPGSNTDNAPKLAGDFAAACHAANARLQQCEAMIRAGDSHQALQSAETAPNLLELIKLLEFSRATEWRAFCQQNALPVAERIESHSVLALNACYAKGITTDHPLYAAFRKAALNRNDEEALKTLQSITRLNPTDTNAAAELARLDAKVLAARLNRLGETLNGGDAALVVEAIEDIEGFGFKTCPVGEVWQKAALVRCSVLLREASAAKEASQWREAMAKVDFIRRQQKDLALELPPSDLKQLEALETWTRAEQEKDRKNREFAAMLSQLRQRIQKSEEKDTSARYVELPELREDFEGLHKIWRSLADFTRPIPDDATAAFRKRSGLLEGEIARRMAIRRRTILATGAVVLLVGVVAIWFVLGQMRARQFARELQAAVSQRQTHVAERILDRVRTNEKRLLHVGSVSAAVANAESFVAKERGLLASFEASFAKLPTQLDGEPDAARVNGIADQLAQTRAVLNALSPDLKTENEPRLNTFEKQWEQFLSEAAVAVNKIYEQQVNGAEEIGSQLNYREPVETASKRLSLLSPIMQKINDCEAGFTNHVRLRSDLLQRAAIVRTRFAAYEGELKKLDEGMAGLKKARSLGDFSSTITSIASSEFSTAPAVSAAAAIQSLGVSEESLLRSLLNATNPPTWAFINRKKTATLVPEIAMPAERTILQQLNADPAVNASHQHYRLWLNTNGSRNVEWITAGSLDGSRGWKQIKAWTVSPGATSAAFEDRDYGNFDGQWKLSATQLVYRVENLPISKNITAFKAVELGKVWPGGDTYTQPLLEALDAVKNSREGSPIFRAYLFRRLVEVMEFQPEGWGLSFCPSARADAAWIRSIVGGEIASGDWFLPSKEQDWNDKLEQFFSARTSVSYAKQAAGNLALAQAVARDGLRYVGFIGMDGKPVLTESQPLAELLGYDASSKRPAVVSASAMPLSPLFALTISRADYLAKAGVDPLSPSFASGPLPLFRVKN